MNLRAQSSRCCSRRAIIHEKRRRARRATIGDQTWSDRWRHQAASTFFLFDNTTVLLCNVRHHVSRDDCPSVCLSVCLSVQWPGVTCINNCCGVRSTLVSTRRLQSCRKHTVDTPHECRLISALSSWFLRTPLFYGCKLFTVIFIDAPPFPSARQHPSYGDCLEVKREYYQNCSVLDCVTQCAQSTAHLYEQFLQVQQIGFVILGPLLRCA